jgi:ABC-2 type transport system ATP-binding protein
MTGGSYGGGIQFSTAAIDPRIDAIVPVIAWHSLGTSLYKARTIKTGWVNVLMTGATQPGNTFDPRIVKGREQAKRGMTFTREVVDFATSAGPADRVRQITAPTLIIQGTIDNLFPLSEAIENYRALRSVGTPVQMTWYCGGHGFCLTGAGDTSVPLQQTWAWLDKYLKGNAAADTGAAFTWIDQRGTWRSAQGYPVASERLRAKGKGSLRLVEKGGSGPYRGPVPEGVNPLTAALLRATIPTPAKRAVEVDVRAPGRSVVVGTPRVRLAYKGTAPRKKIRVLAQFVQGDTVVGNAITPIPLTLDGTRRQATVALEPISATLRKGQRLTLQIVGQSSAYNVFPKGSVRFSKVAVAVPVRR